MKTMTRGMISMKTYLTLLIAGAILLLSACDTLLTDAKDETSNILPDVYLAGGSDPIGPCIYKNGQRIDLEKSLYPSYQYEVNALFIDGDDVYAAGSEYNNSNWGVCYWKNGTLYATGAHDGSHAYSLCVSGYNVYMAGNNTSNIFCIWYNGLRITMPYIYGPNGYTTSINVHDGTIYVTGMEQGNPVLYIIKSTGTTGTGLFYDDPEPANQDYTLYPRNNSTLIVNGEVYIGGYTSPYNYPAYWHNGVVLVLDQYSGIVSSVYHRNGDMYFAGIGYNPDTTESYACYWKNAETTKHWLVPPEPDYSNTDAFSFYISDDNDIVWTGYLQAFPQYYGFAYNKQMYKLKTTIILPHMVVQE